MASLEVNQLMNTALAVSGFHIKDALTRIRFQDNVRDFGKLQPLSAMAPQNRSASSVSGTSVRNTIT
jgi:hypothetical protein